jgi:ABC-type multidrug transport system fused ATPase/permease subunit
MINIPGQRVYKRYTWWFAGLIVLSLLAGAAEMFSIGALVPFLNAALGTEPSGAYGALVNGLFAFLKRFEYKNIFITTCLLFLALTFLKVVLTIARDMLKLALAQRIRFDCKTQMFSKYMHSDLKVFLHNKGGDLIYRCINLPDELSMYFTFLPSIILESINIAVLCLLLSTISLPLFGGVIALGIIYAGVIVLLSRKVYHKLGEGLRDTAIGQNVIAHEAVSGIREIITYGKRDQWLNRFRLEGEKHYSLKLNSAFTRFLPNNILELVLVAAVCVGGIYYGSSRMDELTQMIPVFAVYLMAMVRMIPSFGKIGQDKMQAATYLAAVRMYEKLIDEKTQESSSGNKPFSGFAKDIRFENAHFSYLPGKDVLKGIGLTIPRNKTVAIVSGSGGGKSTIIDLILGFYNLNSGRIAIDGVDLKEYDILQWRRSIGVVSQNSFIFHASVKENIAFDSKDIDMDKVIASAKAAGAHEFLNALKNGYDTILGDRGFTLSGGQRQRVSIARALYRNPEIIIFDEATSALDNRTEQMITQTISEFSHSKTIIILAHRLSTIEKADLIYVIKDGQVAQSGTLDDLRRQGGEFANLYQ